MDVLFFSIKKNRPISRGMCNIYSKNTIEEKWHSQNLDFLSLINSSSCQFLRNSTYADIIEF